MFNMFAGMAGSYVGGAAGTKIGAISGGVSSGVPGAKVGGFIGGVLGAYQGRKSVRIILGDTEDYHMTEEQRRKADGFNNSSPFDKDLLVAFAIGGMTRLALNAMSMPDDSAWRGAHDEINAIRAQMSQEQLDFAAAVLSSDETFRGEMTVVGNSLGSWITYVHKMILINEERARQVFTPIVATENTSRLHNSLVWKMVLEFWNGIDRNLFRNVLLDASTAAFTVYGLKKLFRRDKVEQPKKQTKPQRKRRRRLTRKGKVRMQTAVSQASGRRIDTLRALFRRLDKDKSGALSARELRQVARRFNMTGEQILQRFDVDKGGTITFDEFARFMRPRTTEI